MEEKKSGRKIRIILALPGLDDHDRGAAILAQRLRDAGMEVIYLGTWQTPEMIVSSAIAEDADVIALSYLSDRNYLRLFPRVMDVLHENNVNDIPVICGGRILEEDRPSLSKIGITGFFGAESTIGEIESHIIERVSKERPAG